MTIAHLIIAILVGKFSDDWPAHRSAGWISVAFVSFTRTVAFISFASNFSALTLGVLTLVAFLHALFRSVLGPCAVGATI